VAVAQTHQVMVLLEGLVEVRVVMAEPQLVVLGLQDKAMRLVMLLVPITLAVVVVLERRAIQMVLHMAVMVFGLT
jgi:hypothetical protein